MRPTSITKSPTPIKRLKGGSMNTAITLVNIVVNAVTISVKFVRKSANDVILSPPCIIIHINNI
jgi:stage V sporulation protein SpoVS